MARIEARRALDMRDMIVGGPFAVATQNRIEIVEGDRTAVFEGEFSYGASDQPYGTVLGFSLHVGGSKVFEATGIERYASTAMRLAGWGDNDAFAAYTLSGDDRLLGSKRADYLIGFGGEDTVLGGRGRDRLFGGGDADRLYGGAGDDLLAGGLSFDHLAGGVGDDTYVVDQAADRIVEARGEGVDFVLASTRFRLGSQVENLTLTGAASIDALGNALANALRGNSAANLLRGEDGADVLSGGRGADTLIGGDGRDLLSGGDGADAFRFLGAAESPPGDGRDMILDFAAGRDLIDLSRIDADATRPGDQSFAFLGPAPLSGAAGELRLDNGRVSGDVDGDGRADVSIGVAAAADLLGAHFLL